MNNKQESKKLSVLVIDDSEIDRRQCHRLMKPALDSGWTLTETETMSEALKLCQTQSFQTILLDFHLSDGDGLNHIRDLKEVQPQSAIVVLTGQARKGIDYDAESIGAADFLQKDELTQDTLLRTIRYSAAKAALLHEYRKVAQEAQAAYQAKQSFMLAASHELRTPLQHLVGFSQTLEMGLYGELTPEQHTVMKKLNESAQVLSEAVEDMLRVSEYASTPPKLQCQEVALNDVVKKIIDRFQFAADDKGIDLLFSACSSDPKISADPTRLAQALRQLIENGIKHTTRGQVVVSIDKGPRISIQDTGPGLTRDPFYSVNDFLESLRRSTSRIPEGFGYGIALAHDILSAHHADLSVESSEGAGTLVTIDFR